MSKEKSPALSSWARNDECEQERKLRMVCLKYVDEIRLRGNGHYEMRVIKSYTVMVLKGC